MVSSPVQLGGIYLVADEPLVMPPHARRTIHTTRRPVVVLSGDNSNSDPDWEFVLVAPLSTTPHFKTKFCVAIPKGEGNVSKDTWVRVPAVQPIMKDDLQDQSGVLLAPRIEQIQASLLVYAGIIPE